MGQIQDKCSCMFRKEDKETFKFEKDKKTPEDLKGFETKKSKSKSRLSSEKKLSFKDNLLNSKNINKSKEGDISIISENENENSKAKATIATLEALGVENFDAAIKNIIIFQSIFRSYNFRKKFKTNIRSQLIAEESEFIARIEKIYRSNVVNKLNSEHSTPYKTDNWKHYYDDDKIWLNNFDYGKVYRTKIKVDKNDSYYSGEENIKGEKHGVGELIFLNGTKKEGAWQNNTLCGWCRIIDHDGIIYEGLYENGMLNGKGERITPKSIYKGDFKNGLRHGNGIEDNAEHCYNGEYQNDKKNGVGTLNYKKLNDVYTGTFIDNCITGTGEYTWSNKDTFKGNFLNGKMHGFGTYRWPDGGEYSGQYNRSVKEGKGKFKWSNGKIFDGPFKNGRPHGSGKLIDKDQSHAIEFRDGKVISKNMKDDMLMTK